MTPGAQRLALVATAGIAIAITVLSLAPVDFDSPIPGGDKGHHLIAYAALIFPVALTARSSLFWALPAALALGVTIELVQPSVGRMRELADIVANGVGLALGVMLGVSLARVLARRASARAG